MLLTLPKDLQKSILFGTIKGDTLFIATANKGVCAEINNFRANDLLNAINFIIDSLLRESEANEAIHESKIDCHDFALQNLAMTEREQNLATLRKIKKIKAYIPQNILEILQAKSQQKATTIITEHYKERALGAFKINENSPFKEIFSAIKDAIKRNAEIKK